MVISTAFKRSLDTRKGINPQNGKWMSQKFNNWINLARKLNIMHMGV